MIEKPIVLVGKLAEKVQAVTTTVALKAAKVAEAMSRKAASIQARAAARAEAAAMKALPRKPTVEFLREVGHGRTTLSFYRITNHRAGTVRHVWGLNRVTPEGRRVRLATGSMAELQSLRNIPNRSLTQGTRQEAERGSQSIERAESPRQRNAATTRAQQAQDRPEAKRWYVLIHVEHVGQDGAGIGRVVRNYTDPEKARVQQKRHPSLIIRERVAERPLRQGEVVNVKLSPRAVERLGEDRTNGLKHEGPKAVVNQIAQRQERRPALGH